MKEVPHTELLVGMQDFIDDEAGFLKMLSEISNYPFDLFEQNKNAEMFLDMYENGKIKFDTKEEENEFLSTVFKKK